jgi:LuxR family maltose regulon positive regulatory protein
MSEADQRSTGQSVSAEIPAHPLLQTKLFVPTTRRERVLRPALIARLNEGLIGKLTMISAPAGFGKTTLVADWLQQLERPSAWISLDEGDNDPVRLCGYVLAALQRIEPEIGRATQAMLQAPQPPSQDLLLTCLVNDVAGMEHRFVLVLDDYHLIHAPAIHEAITFLLDHMPPQMHLALTSRADPPLPIALLRGRGQLCELYAADLRFSPDEVAAFLNEVMALDLPAEQVSALERRTEGWITGLQLAALSIRGREDASAFISAFTGSQRYVLDYLTDEVLNRQSEEIQRFLLETAILDRLTGSLCDHVRFGEAEPPSASAEQTGSQSILETLDASNLFTIPLDEERRWYRYHRLFADLLRQRLHQEQGDLVPELHGRASKWYEQRGFIPEAVGHALGAGDDERAADLIEWAAWTTVMRGEVRTLRGWLDRLPSELERSRPQLGILYAWALALGGDLDRVESYLQGVDVQQVPGEVAAVRAYVASLRDEASLATEYAQQVFEYLPERKWFSRGMASVILGNDALISGDPAAAIQELTEMIRLSEAAGRTYLAVFARGILGEALQMQGRLREAAEVQRQALQLASTKGGRPAPSAGFSYIGLSRLHYEWDDLDSAMHNAEKGIEIIELGGLVEAIPAGRFILAQVHLARGQLNQATHLMDEAEQAAQRCGNPYVLARVAEWRMRLRMTHRDRVAVSDWQGQHLPDTDSGTDYLHELVHLASARELMAGAVADMPSQQSRVGEALDLLQRQLEAARAAGRVENMVTILILQALAFQMVGDGDRALSALERALSLAEPEGYVRTFVDEGEPMAHLLRRALGRGIRPSYARKLLSAFGENTRAASPAAQALVEPLTQRELEVLGLLVTGLSNREIAEELVVAVSTVKSHVNHIYGKLGVKSRTQAVARARELDLV